MPVGCVDEPDGAVVVEGAFGLVHVPVEEFSLAVLDELDYDGASVLLVRVDVGVEFDKDVPVVPALPSRAVDDAVFGGPNVLVGEPVHFLVVGPLGHGYS